jgi:hypothetical protein
MIAVILAVVLSADQTLTPAEGALLEQAHVWFQSGLEVRESAEQSRDLFLRAARAYSKAMEQGGSNAELFLSEGNAWLHAGELTRAILAYRRGLALDPAHRGLRSCLEFTRGQVIYHKPENLGRPPAPSFWSAAATAVGASVYFAVAAASYASACALLVWWWTRRGVAALAMSGLLLALAVIAGGLSATQAWMISDQRSCPIAVVAEDAVELRTGNGASYPPKFGTPLHRGVEAKVLFDRGDWVQIELLTGQTGWVPRRALVIVEV